MVDIVTRLGKGSPLTNAEVDANFTNLAEVSGVTGEPMGHEDRTTSTISFNASTRTFTIAPTASSFTVWCKGKKVVVSSAQTVVIPNTTGMHSIYYDANGTLSSKIGYFTFSTEAPTAYVYWNATTGAAPYFGDERHGVVLDWQTHEYLHRTRGAALASGFSASGYVLGGNGSSNSHAQLTIEGGTFFDEDMKIIVTATNTPTAGTWEQDLTSPARIPVLHLQGTAWVMDSPTDYPLKQGTARPQYNAFSGGVWSTADVANNKYATSWILATNNLTYPVIAIIGQAESDLQSAAEAVDFTELQLPGFPSVEFRPLYKLIFQCADSCTNAVHASLVSITDIRSIAAAGTAASIVTDHGNLSGLSDDDHPQYLSVDTVRGSLTAAVKASFLPSQTSNDGKFLQTDGTATSWQALTSGNVTTALGFTPYNATNPSGFITGITSGNVTTALGFTPYNATNPSGYVTAAGARGSISVTGAGSYDSATGVINIVGGVTSFNTRTGAITLSSSDVTTALGFTPYNSTNPNGYLTGITSTQVTTALGYTPYNSSNPSGYITGITSGMVTTALGFTPYNNSNPSGYITSAALSPYLTTASAASTYLTSATAASTYAPLTGTGASGTWGINITGSAGSATSATTAGSTTYLAALGIYVWSASTNGRSFNSGIQTSFVQSSNGYPSYGSVVRVATYSNDGATAELYFPYSSTYGGSAMQYRLGQYDNAGWTGWKTVIDSSNYTNYAATVGHNHTYDVNNAWLRDANDDANVKLYGNTRQMVFRTDGTTEFASGVGPYAFAWMYGGDGASERRMLLTSAGRLWTNTHGWMDEAFAPLSHVHSYLPLSGGTLTGRLITTASAESDSYSGAIRVSPSSTQQWGGISFPDTNAGTSSANNYWFFGRGSAISDRTFTVHIPDYSDYSSTGAIPSWGVYKTGANSLFRVFSNGSVTVGGNTVLNAGNYNSYSPTLTGTGASGTWGISITGNAATATSASSAANVASGEISDLGAAWTAPGTSISNGFRVYRYQAGAASQPESQDNANWLINIYSHPSGGTASYGHQLSGTDTENIWMRNVNNGGFGSWRKLVHSGNYNSYAPTLTGGGASGTWAINITGSAATATDSTKLPLAGGTLSGVLTLVSSGTAINISGQSDSFGYNATAGLGTYIKGTGATYIYGGGKFFDGATSQTLLHAGNYTSYAVPQSDVAQNGASKVLKTASNGYLYIQNWIDVAGNGLFSSTTNGSHFLPNPDTYGSWKVIGTRNGWHGLEFGGPTNGPISLMINPDSNTSGFHNNNYGWQMRWNNGVGYIHKNAYGGGTSATILDSSNYTSYSPSLTGSGASGTWGISISGNAATANSATTADQIDSWPFRNTGNNAGTNADTIESNGITYYTAGVPNFTGNSTDGALYSQAYSSSWQHQIAGDYRSGQIALRGKNNGTWQSWRTVLDSSNYSSYAIPLSGGINMGGSFGLNDSKLFLRTNGDTNHYLWNADDDWEELVAYAGTGFRVKASTGAALLTVSTSAVASSVTVIANGNAIKQGNDLARPLASWGSSGATGMVIFKLPGSSGNYGMLHMVFDIYEYNGNSVSTVIVGGHNWASSWYNTGANVVGLLGKQVRLGYKDGQYCVVFGDASSYWEYGQIVLRKIQNGAYYTNVMDLGAAISVQFTATESFSNIGGDLRALRTPASFNAGGAITQAGNQVLHAGNINSYIPNWGTGVSGNYLVQRDGNGYIYANHINFNTSESENATVNSFITSNGDGWSRKASLGHVKNSIRGVADGTWGINITGNASTASYFPTYYAGGQQTNPQVYFSYEVGLRVAMTGYPNVWSDTLWINGYAGGDVPWMCALHTIRNSEPRMWISAQQRQATSYGTAYEFLSTYNYNSYSPTLTGGNASGTWGISISGSAAQLQGYQWFSAGKDIRGSDIYADSWLRNYNVNTGLYNQSTGCHFYSNGSASWGITGSGAGIELQFRANHQSTVRGYVYADSSSNFGLLHNNGGWAVQIYPGGSGYLHGTWNGGNIRANRANGNLYIDDNYGNGVVGAYASTRYQGVYAMGDSYKLPADGTSTGSLYGMAWSHPNAGGAAGNLTDHGLLIINNGGFRCAISTSIVASANITAYSDERLKTNWRDMPEDYVTRLAKVKVGIYDRVDQEDVTQVGVSAQSFQELLPQAIMTAKDEMQTLSVSYGNAALASAVELAKDNVELRARIERLESLINKLIGD